MLLLVLAAGCVGGMHRQDDHMVVVAGSWGHADPSEPLLWQGDGTADDFGVMVDYAWFKRDRLAYRAAVTPLRVYNESDGNVYQFEFQVGFRHHFWERGRLGLFWEAMGGLSYANRGVPLEGNGTHFNFTQDTGLGFEIAFCDAWRTLFGYRYSHLSNGTGPGLSNPSQNDHEFYWGLGYAW